MQHNDQLRYARNISLPEIGEAGQHKLLESRVLVIGAGGLGSPLLLYLAAAGVGTIGVIDDDRVALSNLQRQIIHETGDIDQPKVHSASEAMHDLNPNIRINTYNKRLTSANIDEIIKDYDVIADGCDNYETRFLVNKTCFTHKKPLVSGAVIGFSGHLYTFKPYLNGNNPCYQCLYPQQPAADATPKCSESGVLGSVTGIIGAWQATEVVKELLEIGESLSGNMVILDALYADIRKVKLTRDPDCKTCRHII